MTTTIILTAVALVVIGMSIGLVVSRRRTRRPFLERTVETKPGPGVSDERSAAEVLEGTTGVLTPREEKFPIPAPAQAEPVAPPSLRERLTKSRRFFSDRLRDALGSGVDEETWDDVEAALIQADIGVTTATKVVGDLRDAARESHTTDVEGVRSLLASELQELFESRDGRNLSFALEGPSVWLVVGVNGTGKTTTVGKLAGDLNKRGRTVALAAADTFRAAADEQLQVWAERTEASLIKHKPGGDPGAVAFDAFAYAKARGYDVLLVDTAGRLHTKTPLMDELAKIKRVIEKEGHVDEVLLVIDATAGQNGLNQARQFAEAAGVTGIVLTKLDGTAKGGIALAIEQTLGIPIKLIGVGEGLEDLRPFEPKAFVDALLT